MSDFEETKKALCEMLEDLDQRLAKITNDVKHTEQPLEKDFAEQATQVENDQVLDYLGNAARKEIDMIKRAIARIDSGEYGVCEACGESVGKERLKVLPYSTLCIKCANQAGC
ncbi:MAG: TraR/DksA family transcriptional regulator [Methylococcales bacterium]